MVQLVLILDNIRSSHNVGSILRTCDSSGVSRVIMTGITPYPRLLNDSRDPVVSANNSRKIAKTSLGAEQTIQIEYISSTAEAVSKMKNEGRTIYGLEIAPRAVNLLKFEPNPHCALIVGNEVDGLNNHTLGACDEVLMIPQRGSKESLNVSVATGIALYHLLK
jgi:23S rRNA (guanosine2251-2'-O)-methyltransferase